MTEAPAIRRLYLVRHARADDPPHGTDHERPLAFGGVRDAARLADHLVARGAAPGLVLCSSARRAVETLAPLRARIAASTSIRIEQELYLAGPERLLGRLAAVDDRESALLLVAHNPGVAALARSLAGRGEPGALARLEQGMAAGALAELHLACPRWRDLASCAGRLETFVSPEDLR